MPASRYDSGPVSSMHRQLQLHTIHKGCTLYLLDAIALLRCSHLCSTSVPKMMYAWHDSLHTANPLSQQRGPILQCALWTGWAGICLAFSTQGRLNARCASNCEPWACTALQAHALPLSCKAECSSLEGVPSTAANLYRGQLSALQAADEQRAWAECARMQRTSLAACIRQAQA